ncbi:MAG: hypothetical protein K0R38_503 [Polyangiaceae bacterium]|jgi:hypothetical protein|nr:hypothetical protein [Polyangiaceae bacterium]
MLGRQSERPIKVAGPKRVLHLPDQRELLRGVDRGRRNDGS